MYEYCQSLSYQFCQIYIYTYFTINCTWSGLAIKCMVRNFPSPSPKKSRDTKKSLHLFHNTDLFKMEHLISFSLSSQYCQIFKKTSIDSSSLKANSMIFSSCLLFFNTLMCPSCPILKKTKYLSCFQNKYCIQN